MSNNFNLDKLNSIGPGVDLSEVSQINKKRLLTFINDFVITTVSFLNNFAQSCESRLHQFDLKMQKLEAELCIIETKLSSIPGLEVSESENIIEIEQTKKPDLPVVNVSQNEMPQPVEKEDKPPEESEKEAEPEPDQTTPTSARQNPELAKYFKMVQLGVPAQAVKLKMQCEGFDPNLLDG